MPLALVTGASTGIGRATALRLVANGWTVLAGVRGPEAGAVLHLARTAGRRAERRVVELFETEQCNPETIVYLNRLSDLMFILARVVNHRAGVPEMMTDFSKRKVVPSP